MEPKIHTKKITLSTKGHNDVVDITPEVERLLSQCALTEGSVLLFVVGSTAGLSTVEYEPGLVKTDLPEVFERIAPYGKDYAHHETWGDDNGASHLRATLLGSSLEVPFAAGSLLLGTWQQIILIDFDTRPRKRSVVAQFKGI